MATGEDLVEYDVFISYSRADKAVALELLHAVRERGKNAWLDEDDIHHGVDFIDEIYEGIEKSENFVFLISPDSVNSEVCKLELEHALELNKRIIPILLKTTPTTDVHKGIATINWIITEDNNWGQVADDLMTVLNTDVEHVKLHTILLREALAWDKENHPNSMVLRGRRLHQSVEWIESAEDKEPAITLLHRKFIRAGQRNRTRTQRRLVSWVSVALMISIGLTIYALYERSVANERADIAESRQIAITANNLEEKNPELSSLLSVKAAHIYATKGALAELLNQCFAWTDVHAFIPTSSAYEAVFSPDGKYLILRGATIQVWDVEKIEMLSEVDNIFTSLEIWDSTSVFMQSDSLLRILSIPSLETLTTIPIKYAPYTYAIHGKDKKIVVLFNDGLELFDYDTKQSTPIEIPGFRYPASNLKLNFDNNGALALYYGDTLFKYDVAGDSMISTTVPDLTKKSRSWQDLNHSNNYFISFADDQSGHVLNIDSAKFISTGFININPQATLNLAYSEVNNIFAVGYSSSTLLLHMPHLYQPIDIGFDGKKYISDLCFNDAGTQLAVTYQGDGLTIYNVPLQNVDETKLAQQSFGNYNGPPLLTFEDYIAKVSGRTAETGSKGPIKETTVYWDTKTIDLDYTDDSKDTTITIEGFENHESSSVSNSQLLLFYSLYDESSNTAELIVYDLPARKVIAKNKTANYTSSGAYAFSEDESRIAFYNASPEPLYVLWDLETNTFDTLMQQTGVQDFDNYSQFFYDHTGEFMAIKVGSDITVYNLETNEITSMEKLGNNCYDLEFHPTEPRLYGRFDSQEITIWDLESGMQIGRHYRISDANLSDWYFDWENELLWTLDMNGTVRKTPLNAEQQMTELLRKAVRDFTQEEWDRYFPEDDYAPLRGN